MQKITVDKKLFCFLAATALLLSGCGSNRNSALPDAESDSQERFPCWSL